METAERYRQYAADCMRLARKTESLAEKDLLVQMAVSWRQLAERVEKEAHKS